MTSLTAIIPVNSMTRHTKPLIDTLSHRAMEIIASGHYVLGPNVQAFENEFATYCGASSAIGVGNGTEALELGLRGLGVTNGDTVAVVANAAMYGTMAVLACGATPMFVDVNTETATMSPVALKKLMADTSIKPKAIIVTHLYGRLADMPALMAIADSHKVLVLEDCAQAHGAMDQDGRRAGNFGKAACFSFYPTKNLGALGDGGAVVTSDVQIERRVRQLRQYGWRSKYNNELAGGRNSRLDEIQAAFLRIMLGHLDDWNQRRREIANRYSLEIRHPDIRTPAMARHEYVAHLYVIRTSRRAELQAYLRSRGVESDVHYPIADHNQLMFDGRYKDILLPATDQLCNEVLTLPCFPELTDAEVARVIDACNRW